MAAVQYEVGELMVKAGGIQFDYAHVSSFVLGMTAGALVS